MIDVSEIKENTRQRIGKRIAELRRERGLSQEELAGRIGIHQSALNRIEMGRHSTTVGMIAAIAAAMDCRVEIITNDTTENVGNKLNLNKYDEH